MQLPSKSQLRQRKRVAHLPWVPGSRMKFNLDATELGLAAEICSAGELVFHSKLCNATVRFQRVEEKSRG